MRSRFKTQSSGKPREITTDDRRVCQLLEFYPYLPSNYIVELLGLNARTWDKRFTVLRHDLKLIYPPRQSWATANARYRPAVYANTPAGRKLTPKNNLPRERDHRLTNVPHDLAASVLVASMEIGAKKHGFRFLDWGAMKQREECEVNDYRLTIPVTINGERHEVEAEPDWSPFTIAGTNALTFFGVEIDRHTEPGMRSRADATSVIRKFLTMREFTRHKLFKKLGVKNCFFPFATIDADWEGELRQRLLEMTDNRGARDILFTTMPDFTSFENFPEANDWALTPWRRAGFPDFNILEELHGHGQAGPNPRTHRNEATN